MTSTVLQIYEAALAHTPLQKPLGQAWLTANGSIKDFLADRLRLALKERFPNLCTADALVALGVERQIDRGIGETDVAFALRVQGAWATWPFAGTAFGMLTALAAVGYNVVLPQVVAQAYSLSGGNLVVTQLGSTGWLIDPPPTFWSKFVVLFPPPLPISWLAGGLTSVAHGGAGAGTVVASGTPTTDVRVVILITTGGAAGGAAQFKYSTDNGTTLSVATALPSGAFIIPNTGITVTFSGTFTLNDVYSFAPTFNVPADGSSESLRIKTIVNKWKPGHATVSRYVIHTQGTILGWPASNKLGVPPTGGTAGGAQIYLGNSSTVTWGP